MGFGGDDPAESRNFSMPDDKTHDGLEKITDNSFKIW